MILYTAISFAYGRMSSGEYINLLFADFMLNIAFHSLFLFLLMTTLQFLRQ